LAAAKLGASRIDAIDADAVAVRTAKQNARLNGLSRKLRIWRQDVLKFQAESVYDVVTANLYSVLLRQALPQLVKATRKGGFLIFSGILRDQETDIKEWVRETGLELKETRSRGKWTTLLAKKNRQ